MSNDQKTDRWGGPGASEENRDKPRPDAIVKEQDAPDHSSRHSQVSGGGGERDVHQSHEDDDKGAGQAGNAEKRQG